MYPIRLWSVRHAQGLSKFYGLFSRLAPAVCKPLARVLGTQRLEAVLQPIEKHAKGLFFDCKMCGQCVLSSTGMS